MAVIEQLSAEQVNHYRAAIKQLLDYCKCCSSGEQMPEAFFEAKVNELVQYVAQAQGFVFGALEADKLIGFLWACEIGKENTRRFHIMYFAVSPDCQKQGIGSALMDAAERKAQELGIYQTELNVHTHNPGAMEYYVHHGYAAERITMKKDLRK